MMLHPSAIKLVVFRWGVDWRRFTSRMRLWTLGIWDDGNFENDENSHRH